jgi:SAM-dependent methyltransferase
MSSKFDAYSAKYTELLRDPLRDGFASAAFFHVRKWTLIREFWKRRGVGLPSLDWLDIGCGQGDLLRLGATGFRSAAGCDPSREMLQPIAGAVLKHQKSPAELPFESGAFDFATAVCVYHHVDASLRAPLTAEAGRVLRSGGVLAIIEHNPWNPVTQAIVRRSPVDADAHLLTARRCRELVRRAGLDFLATEHFLYLPELLHGYAAPVERALSRLPMGGQYAVFARKG